ncbi:hypothetical protein [Halobellus sp. H-GB7]|uniref:hypothetical protein n=1 Tax=Halobellus sp. H-GB7 TaxID=3069756 RepID=UPI0027B74D5B|nr:hypothetical protein [Halobellus sp. H-GB7]MDQ2053663.1 hypothetical protein [Halobellus sp. H-GB7]
MSIKMTDLQTEEQRVEKTVNGVTVRKELRETESGITVVVFTLMNGRDDEVAVDLDEPLPEDFSVEKVGLHPEYNSDRWTVTKERLIFEAIIDGGEGLVTLYGVDVESAEKARPFLTDPQVDTSIPLEDPLEDDGSTEDTSGSINHDELADHFSELDEVTGEGSAALSTSADGGTDVVEDDTSHARPAGVGEEEAEAADEAKNGENDETGDVASEVAEEVRPADDEVDLDEAGSTNGASDATGATEEFEGEQAEKEPVDEADAAATEEESGSNDVPADALTRDDLLSCLVEELEDRTLTSRERSVLVESLGVGKVNTLDARLRRTQRTVEDLSAYEDALAEFIEHNGGAAQVIDELRTEIDELRGDVAAIEDELGETHEKVAALQSDMDATSDAVESVRGSVEELEVDHEDAVTGLETDLDELEDTVEDLSTSHESAINSLESDVESFRDWQRSLSEAIEFTFTDEE